MKRVFLITFEFPPSVGGAESYFFELCRRTRNTDFTVLAPPHPQAEAWDAERSFRILRRPFLSSSLFPHWLPLLWNASKVLRHHPADVIWVGQCLPGAMVGWVLARLFRRPFGIHTNGMDITVPMQSRRRRWFMRRLIRAADFLTTISHYTQQQLVDLGAAREKIHFVFPCASLREEQTDLKMIPSAVSDLISKHHWDHRRILLTVGRLVERKGHDRVIQAMPRLLSQHPDLLYVIAGDGPERGRLEQLVRSLHLEQHVEFAGKVSDQELPFYFAACELFIMACRELANGDVEGFGIVFLEANLFGKPVIGGNSGGVPSAVEDHRTGLLVDPNSEEEIAQTIHRLLSDRSLAARLGSTGRHRALEQFNWDVQAEALERVWNTR